MFTILADAALKGLVLLAAIAFVTLFMRRASAARRHLTWTLAMVGLLVLPLLSATLPAWRVTLLPAWTVESVADSPPAAVLADIREPIAHAPVLADTRPMPPVPQSPVTDQVTTATTEVTAAPGRERAEPFRWQSLWVWIVPLWCVGAIVVVSRPLAGLWQLSRLRLRAKTLTNDDWQKHLFEVRGQLGLRRRVELLTSPDASIPLTFGALRPALLLPMEAVDWPLERRSLVLLHELAHIKRWDWLSQMTAHVSCGAHWFNPLAWLAVRRMQIEREQACDDLVLASGAKASDYARELLAIATHRDGRTLLALAAVPMARRLALEDRLRAILDGKRNREALTVATAGVAFALLATVLFPLAMLQAGGPAKPTENMGANAANLARSDEAEPSEKAATVKPPDQAAEEPDPRSEGIRLSVLNAQGDKGIAAFRVIAGVPAAGIADEYEMRTNTRVVNWQPHTIQAGKDGEYIWPLERAYEEMALRVEADGCVPSAIWVKRSDGAQHLVFMLQEDAGVRGRVLQLDGSPAAGATVALSMPQRDAVWQDGRLRHADEPLPESLSDRWRIPLFVKTDAEGRFQLPTEPEAAAVLIVHESGVRELAYSDFQKSPEVTLQGWGRIEGQVLWMDKPGADTQLHLSVHRDVYGYPGMVASYATTQSGPDGRFTFDKVLPGLVQLSRPIPVSQTNPEAGSMNFDGLLQHVEVQASEPTSVVFGGQGRDVTGKLTGRASWKDVTFHFHPRAPHIGFPGDNAAWQAFAEFRKSDLGPLFFRDQQPVQADGTFIIKNVLPGTYQVFFSSPDAGQHLAYLQIQVEPEVAGQPPKQMDLGQIAVKEPAAPPDANAQPTELEAFLERVRQSQRGPFGGTRIATNERGDIVGLSLDEFELQPGDAALIGQLAELSQLSLRRSNATDADLQHLKGLHKLTALDLWDVRIGDAGVAALGELSALASLRLGGTDISDEGLKSIARLTALRELDLARTRITNAGLEALSPLSKLVSLKLAETPVTDAGLAALDKWPALRGVTLDETGVTARGLERLAMRANLGYMAADTLVAQELADRMSAGDAAGVEAMLSIGVDLPRAGTFKTRSITAHPVAATDTEEQRRRFRIEWDWNNNGKTEGLFAEIAVRQGTASVIEAGVLETAVQPLPKQEVKTLSIRGTVVDDETGKPVAPLIVQAGKFELATPDQVTWGYSESRSSATDGSFSTTVRLAEGWTARIVADGYLPQQVLTEAPPEGNDVIEVVIRLKRGRAVRGQVLDHKGQPVKGMAVFAVGPTGVNLSGGKANNSWGEEDNQPRPVITDDLGRFELPVGDATKVAVSGSAIDAWPAEIAKEGDTIVRLPEPARVEVLLDIEGAEKESSFFLQLLVGHMPGFEGVRIENTLPIANPGSLTLAALPPGKYQFCRSVTNNLGMIGIGEMLERQFIELKPGETRTINLARDRGARVSGQLTLPEVKLMGIVVRVTSEKAELDPFDNREWTTTYASTAAAEDGSYQTERLSPGSYLLDVAAYEPLTPEQQFSTGFVRPTYGAKVRIEVPEMGEIVVPELKLERLD